jgi:hypothetical protein
VKTLANLKKEVERRFYHNTNSDTNVAITKQADESFGRPSLQG